MEPVPAHLHLMSAPDSSLLQPLDHPRGDENTAQRLDLGDVQAERLSCGRERRPGVLVELLQEAHVIVGEFCVRLGAVHALGRWRRVGQRGKALARCDV